MAAKISIEKLKKYLCWLPAALWYALIWALSSQPAVVSSGVSDGVIGDVLTAGGTGYGSAEKVVRLAVEELLAFFVRKAAHIFLFFVLAVFVWLAFMIFVKKRPLRALFTALVCLALSALDEYHQTLVPGRSGELRDVLVDMTGIVIMLILLALPAVSRWLRSHTKHPERLWLIGAVCMSALLIAVGMLSGVAPMFAARVTQLDFFMDLEKTERTSLVDSAAPILKEALFFASSAVGSFVTVCIAALSENKKAVFSALGACLVLSAAAAAIWTMSIAGAALSIVAGLAAILVWKLYPLLRK